MEKRNKRHEKRVKRLLVGTGLCAIILSVSTYAWFIGMKTVNVTAFDVEIAAIDGLSLSLDGTTFSDSVTINEDNYNNPGDGTYTTNTNSWGGEGGLIPMSSVGIIDTTSSNLVLYEKGSFTASPGGYRVMASKVENTDAEQDGYVAFDLFVKNLSGNEYYDEVNILNEEGIYLTPQSVVKTGDAGEASAGIENSVRVAFAQIGRVIATEENTAKIQGIDCTGGDGVSAICDDRDATIWEPNDTKHVGNAIEWYKTSCVKRIAQTITDPASFVGTCGNVADGTFVPTYAISGVIDYTDEVDVYDGTEYNGWTGSVNATAQDGKLMKVSTFTDSMKNLKGTDRPELFYLAPNSITKVRVYIWIEGQDVDNYDFASLGGQISVSFGFTKEQLYGEDINYDGDPQLPVDVDKRPTLGE